MKTKNNMLFLAAVFIMTAVAARTSKPELLMGSWKIKSLQAASPANVTNKEKARNKKIIANDEKNLKKSSIYFSKDGTLTLGKKKFSWIMNSNGSEVKVMKGNKEVTVATIRELSAHQLVFIRPDEGMKVTYTLTRQSNMD